MGDKKKQFENKRYLSLEILRFILSFWIIIIHCQYVKNKKILNIINRCRFHVPTFMIIAFYFYYNCLFQRNISKIKQRFKRILIPYVIWPLLFLFFKHLFCFFKLKYFKTKLFWKDYALQLIFGRQYYSIFWFHFTLLFLSLLFAILSFSFKNFFLFILQIISILSYYSQYSNTNIEYFGKYSILVSRSLGCICEMLPLAVSGLTLGSFNIISKIKKGKGEIFILSFLGIHFLFKYRIFTDVHILFIQELI
jgi:fucose 4-O-acetylase-like acetyltransferase